MNSYVFVIILVLFLGVSSSVVYFIRKKRVIGSAPGEGSDFDILDE